MRAFKRTERINKELQRVLAEVIRSEVRDPRVHDVVVVSVRVSADLSVANVYVDTVTGDVDDALEGLTAAQGFIRSLVGSEVRLKRTPRFRFFKDGTAELLEKMDELFQDNKQGD